MISLSMVGRKRSLLAAASTSHVGQLSLRIIVTPRYAPPMILALLLTLAMNDVDPSSNPTQTHACAALAAFLAKPFHQRNVDPSEARESSMHR